MRAEGHSQKSKEKKVPKKRPRSGKRGGNFGTKRSQKCHKKGAAQRLGADRPRQKSFAQQSAQGNWLSSRASIPAVPGSIPGAGIQAPRHGGVTNLKYTSLNSTIVTDTQLQMQPRLNAFRKYFKLRRSIPKNQSLQYNQKRKVVPRGDGRTPFRFA